MIEMIIEGRSRDLGGFEVKRVLPFAKKKTIGAFIFLDQMGPAEFSPGNGIDVRPHPHIGLSTVTYLFEGRIVHRDSLGYVQEILPGEVNWMTAGSGVVHSERTAPEDRENGYSLYGIQVWVALPKKFETVEPSFFHHKSHELPEFEKNGVKLKLILGSAYGHTSPVKTYSDMFYLDVQMQAQQKLLWPKTQHESGIYVVEGELLIDGQKVSAGNLAVFKSNMDIQIEASASVRAMILGGEPLDGSREIFWNFVASSKEKIEDAKERWKAQSFPKIKGETEFIPLPD